MGLWSVHAAMLPSVMRGLRRSREELTALRDRRLRALIAHAYARVPYYRRLFDRHGLRPSDIRTVADLTAVPMTTKDDLRAVPVRDTVARGIDPARLSAATTSGSSGEPFTTRRTWLELRFGRLFWLRAQHDAGMRPTDMRVTVSAPPPGESKQGIGLKRVLAALGIYRRATVSCLLPPEQIVEELLKHRPDFLTGYSGVLAHVAAALEARDPSDIRPRAMMAGAELLTEPMRRSIEGVFGVPVRQSYGSRELNLIAWECAKAGVLHTCDDAVVVEVLKDGRPARTGEQGELVGTNLHYYAMPFIRYRQGDIVTKGADECSCRLPFGTIQGIQGRTADYVRLPGGGWLHPYQITDVVIETADWVRRHQVCQRSDGTIALHVVPTRHPTGQEVRKIEQCVRKALGHSVPFRVELVERIERDPRGKYPMARSKWRPSRVPGQE